MSPYLACMNTLCAWPSPDRLSDAIVCLWQSDRDDDNQTDGKAQDMVPMEEVDQNDIGKKKIGRHPRRYWRFIGLRNDGDQVQSISIGQKDNESGDDDDALSIRAPSSHARFSTAIEVDFDCSRPLPSSSSSYHFSPRIFPRHQVSLGAGMRNLYQDAEIEANKREGEARAQRIMDTVGEDEPIINPHPSSSPMLPSSSNQSLDSNDPLKKANKKVKHRLKKLKDAFYKLTPSSMHSSPNRYSTALHGKTPKELGPNQGTSRSAETPHSCLDPSPTTHPQIETSMALTQGYSNTNPINASFPYLTRPFYQLKKIPPRWKWWWGRYCKRNRRFFEFVEIESLINFQFSAYLKMAIKQPLSRKSINRMIDSKFNTRNFNSTDATEGANAR
ncbi:hypothetical protein BY996DRAFT_8439915 [Phakopsora pachyrhizi]|nr:hypothetical protein BY996DRAFT_8439915 [Phakopsora pachyrhizi]